ncbi:Transposon Tf2-9 polyprotein [Portunus trituberculatus]|uniref:Transposon Tf2-9 polyprotein n=1 Tax=Portunus trituberculatus TaxID=210409 RepID=A0A5B7ECI0_PORTR|nr:Transposon Tf2-9 polyprotein [Portunus trituberculatus]
MHRIISRRAVWPGMRKEIKEWVRTCLPCQAAKTHRHTRTPLQTIPTPTERFHTVHIDLVGPLPPCHVHRYLLTCVDRTTRWGTAILMPDSTAEATEKEDVHHTPAELVYGEDLRLSGQFAAPGPPGGQALAFLPVLRQAMANLQPTPPRPPPSRPTHFPADLRDAAAVFLRSGATTGPLQPPYMGPYRVL